MGNQRPHVPSNPLTQTIVNRVEFVSAQMIGTAGFTSHDRDDIRQILFREVIIASDNFRPDRGSYHTFAYKVILAAGAQIYRDRIARGNDCGSISLSSIPEDVLHHYEEEYSDNTVDRAMLRLEVREFVATLPEPPQSGKFPTNRRSGSPAPTSPRSAAR